MPQIFTAADAAKLIGCHVATVSRAAKKHGVGSKLGPIRVFSKADLEKLKRVAHAGKGNPIMLRGAKAEKKALSSSGGMAAAGKPRARRKANRVRK